MNFRSTILIILSISIANAAHPHIHPIGITQRFGVADVFSFVPGITRTDVCSTCIRVLSGVKDLLGSGVGQGTSQINSFANQGCDQLVGVLQPLGLSTIGPFCREVAQRLLILLVSGSQYTLNLINPQVDCRCATFC